MPAGGLGKRVEIKARLAFSAPARWAAASCRDNRR